MTFIAVNYPERYNEPKEILKELYTKAKDKEKEGRDQSEIAELLQRKKYEKSL